MPLGPWELAIILVIIITIFGVGKLPEIGGALGKGIREFKESSSDPGVEMSGNAHAVEARVEERRSEPLRTETAKEEL
jgi:sec-independent protein translocase protein TatA